jgi:hypothetical protein
MVAVLAAKRRILVHRFDSRVIEALRRVSHELEEAVSVFQR